MRKTTTKDKSMSFIRALVHGESGSGKTTSLGTRPEDRTVVAAAERGLVPLRGKAYEVLVIESWDDVRELVRTMSQPYQIGDKPATVLAIDSLSEFGELCKRQIVSVDRKALVKERTNDKSDKPSGIYDDLMTMEDWGLYRNRMLGMISAVCHLQMHIVCTSLCAWTENKKTGELHIAPNLGGKVSLECAASFDLVFYMKSDEGGARVWQTYNDGQVIAKDASGKLDQLEAPSWSSVFTKILNGGAK